MRYRRIVLLLTFLGFISSCSANDQAQKAFLTAADQYEKAIQEEGVIGGAAAFVVPGQEPIIRYYGQLEKATDRAVDDKTIFHWASVTKVFTAVAAMQLIERGELSFDDKAVDFIPELNRVYNSYGPMSDITIRHLLTHSAGFRGSTFPWNVNGDEKHGEFQPHEPPSWTQLEATFPFTEVQFKPGSKASYSNLGITILGRIIEIVSLDTIEGYITNNIFKPLGMHNSFFDHSPWHLKAYRTHGYWLRDGKYTDNGSELDTGITHANGGINATMPDMVRFVRFLLGQSEVDILQADTLASMLEPQIEFRKTEERKLSIGLGFFVIDETNAAGQATQFFGHAGYQGGHRSSIQVAHDRSGALIFAANTARQGAGNPSALNLRKAMINNVFPVLEK